MFCFVNLFWCELFEFVFCFVCVVCGDVDGIVFIGIIFVMVDF